MIARRISTTLSVGLAVAAMWLPGCENTSAPAAATAKRSSRAIKPAAAKSRPAPVPVTTRNASFDDLKFDIEPGQAFERALLTQDVEQLLGKRIRIRGYVRPTAQQMVRHFILVRDNQECCFGPKAALYDCIRVQMNGGQELEFTPFPIAVEGTLTLKELKIGDQTWAIFFLTADEAG